MRLIHCVGRSGSGKTTLITQLVPELVRLGKVGTIKHLGHHRIDLPKGKDTTLHYLSGASIGVGIDDEKTILTCKGDELIPALDILANAGIDFAVIEGFKAYSFSSIIIGDLEGTGILKDPTPAEIIEHISDFEEYHTLSSLLRLMEMRSGHVPSLMYQTFTIPGRPGEQMNRVRDIKDEIQKSHPSLSIILHVQNTIIRENTSAMFLILAGSDPVVIREMYLKMEARIRELFRI